jgi:hypothetical protein
LNILPLWSIFCSLFLSCGVVWTTMPPNAGFSTAAPTCTRRLYGAQPQATAETGDFYSPSTRLKWKCEKRETFTSPTKWKKCLIMNYKIPAVSYMPWDILSIENVSGVFRDVCWLISTTVFQFFFQYEPSIELDKAGLAQNRPRWVFWLFSCFHHSIYLDSASSLAMADYLLILSVTFFTNTFSTRCWGINRVFK